jgi:F0F1-type ATP synthase assembly protein I
MEQKPEDNSGFAKSFRDVGPYLGLGLQLAITIIAAVLLGSWLDDKFHQKYTFTLIFAILGIGVGLYNLIKTVNYLDKQSKSKDEKK